MARLRVEEVVRYLGIEGEVLAELRREGLFEDETLERSQAEELRVAACLVRDLGVNPAGVEVILHMRRRLLVLHQRMDTTVRRLLDEAGSPDEAGSRRPDER